MFIILINLLVCVDLNCSFSFCVPETTSKETTTNTMRCDCVDSVTAGSSNPGRLGDWTKYSCSQARRLTCSSRNKAARLAPSA